MLQLDADFDHIREPFEIFLADNILDDASVQSLYQSAPLTGIRRIQVVNPNHEKQYAMNMLYLVENGVQCDVAYTLPPYWSQLLDDLLSPKFMKWLESGTRLSLSRLNTDIAIYTHTDGDFISVHKDKSNKAMTAILYLNHKWPEEYGGHYEVHESSDPNQKPVRTILPAGGRFLAFAPTDSSWHAVSQVRTGGKATRLTVQFEFWYEKENPWGKPTQKNHDRH